MAGLAALGTALKGMGLAQALQIGGTILSTGGAIAQGRQQKAVADYNAAQLEQDAKRENAIAQRRAEDERKQKELVISRARVVGAASGGGQDFGLLGDIEEEGEYRANLALWEGEEASKGRRQAARGERFKGRVAQKAAGKTLLGGGVSFMDKYA